MEPERREEHIHKEVERPTNESVEQERGSIVGYAAIKYAAIVIIVIAILYFLAVFVVPLLR